MKVFVELVVFLGLFTLLVKIAAGNNGINALYFYPKEFQETAYRRGLADRENVRREQRSFMIFFILVLLAALVIIIHLNKPENFVQAYLQALMFLEIMNWYDGIVIDRIWVSNSRLWTIEGMEDIPYVQTWKQILTKRMILSVIWLFLAAVVAGCVMLTGGIK